jgi:hypothetical protein
MKKTICVCFFLVLSTYSYSQESDKQYLICDGVSFRGQLPKDSPIKKEAAEVTRKFSTSMAYRKFNPKDMKSPLDTMGLIMFSNVTFEVCWVDLVQLKFRRECAAPKYPSSVKNIEEIGTLDKVTGKFYYEHTYEYEGKTSWNGYTLTCKKVEAPVVQ